MNKKFNEFGMILTTAISALLFCSLVIITSLSPLSEFGPNANKFGSFGMWSAIGMVLFFYTLPLSIYKLSIVAMRFIMAIFCSIGVLINFSTIGIVLVLGLASPYFVGIIGICIAALLVNFIWFFVAFRSPVKPSTILDS